MSQEATMRSRFFCMYVIEFAFDFHDGSEPRTRSWLVSGQAVLVSQGFFENI